MKQLPLLRSLASLFCWLMLIDGGVQVFANSDANSSSQAEIILKINSDECVDQWRLLEPFWKSNTCWRESILFLQKDEKSLPQADLLFIPSKILLVQNARGDEVYELGRDYLLDANSQRILLPKTSRIPYKKMIELYPKAGESNGIAHKVGDPNTYLLIGDGHMFHDLQIEISYEHKDQWVGYKPDFAGHILTKTMEKLHNNKPLKICLCGDSISQGYNASGYTKTSPYMPPYGELLVNALSRRYGSKITFKNFAIAGRSAARWADDVSKIVPEKPDLVIIAYGMNDVGDRNPEAFKGWIANLISETKKADTNVEFILVASMLGNPEWVTTPIDQFSLYRDALKSLTGQGIALADMTALWSDILKHKKFIDITGNGVNHPNDFGQRLYAEVILELLIPYYTNTHTENQSSFK